ncbi:dynamin-like GTPase SEY1, partial [Ascoidea rubescens DSM 1968]
INHSIQIINEQKDFNKKIMNYVKDIVDQDIGFNYHVISVFGSQSTGKSTLLNALFGTKFDVMNQDKRQQTTKGIWLAYAPNIASHTNKIHNDNVDLTTLLKVNNINTNNNASTTKTPTPIPNSHNNTQNIFVMDIEGTDGRERGEDQDFERKAALFALATSEVLLINIWENQIGLYQGANLGLLKTVFEVNLSLFSNKNQKCLLLFVIRDFTATTTLDSLADSLIDSLNKIWSQLQRPKGTEDFQLNDFFDLRFFALPHKVFQPLQFTTEVSKLGDQFQNVSSYESQGLPSLHTNNQSIFNKRYHRNIPLDGWTIYAENVWDQIESNKDLDLPTQQILVARFRCDEISNLAYQNFEKDFNQIFNDFDGKILPSNFMPPTNPSDDFTPINQIIDQLKEKYVKEYDLSASRYAQHVYDQKRIALINKIFLKLKEIYSLYLLQLRKLSIDLFFSNFQFLKKSKEKFNTAIQQSKQIALDYFTKNSKDCLLLDAEIFDYSLDLKELQTSIDESIKTQTAKELDNLINIKIIKRFTNIFNQQFLTLLLSPDLKTWNDSLSSFNSTLSNLLLKFKSEDGSYDFGLGLSDEESIDTFKKIQRLAWESFDSIIHNQITEEKIVNLLRERFEDKFRYDEENVPKLWSNALEVDQSYKVAKEYAFSILPILAIAKTDDGVEIIPDVSIYNQEISSDVESDDEELNSSKNQRFAHILSAEQQNSIKHKFKRQADAMYVEAKRSTIQSITSIPYWIYIIIAILGYDEFMAIIKNPLYITLIIVLGAAAYFTHAMNLWGPLLSVSTAMFNETVKVSKQKLREILNEDSDS